MTTENSIIADAVHPKTSENPLAYFQSAQETVLSVFGLELQLPDLSNESAIADYCKKIFLLSVGVGSATKNGSIANKVMLLALSLSRFISGVYGYTPLTPNFLETICEDSADAIF